jgi:hypothetical protein
MPDMNEFRLSVLVYFLQQHKKENTKQGLAVLEHAAKLMHTTNSLVGQMSSVTLLKVGNRFAEILNLTETALVSEDSLMSRRVSWAWKSISLLPWLTGKLRRLRALPETKKWSLHHFR